MMMSGMISEAGQTDSELVRESLSGDRDAFGEVVSRYQSLVCSLAYSATGSLSQSEDIAQDTFLTAWKQLSALREPEKLRPWLCGIARNLINNWLRKEGREPSHHAESLEDISEPRSLEPPPAEQAITDEEEAVLWRSLERIPVIYREPLILYYREHQSVETVAADLELTEDAVKQRLSRGRKLLQEQVLSFVEGALGKTTPGKAFTLHVVAALPLLAAAQSATVGATAAKGGTAIKMLFMTKTTQAIVVAAVTVTAVLTTQTVWHHYHPAYIPRANQRAQTQTPLTPQQASEATQAAKDFFDAVANGDRNAIAKFWPPRAPKTVDDIFTDQLKQMMAGMEVVSMGTPYREGRLTLVPYEVQFKNGGTQTNSLRLQHMADGQWIWIGGF